MENYTSTIAFLFEQLPIYQRQGSAAIKKGLKNIEALCEGLDHPEQKFKSIHIAGTNGKGSTAHMLAAVLTRSGYRTGLYTSPHLVDYRERIKINGAMIPKQTVVDFVTDHKRLMTSISPSFFEITVALAFYYFATQAVDIAIIETGLGGRLDSTNIIRPILSIITTIGYDHQAILGDTLPQIALEKAGIIKDKVPVVLGSIEPTLYPVFEVVAKKCQSQVIYADNWVQQNQTDQYWQFTYEKYNWKFARPQWDAQQINLKTVLTALSYLPTLGFSLKLQELDQLLEYFEAETGLKGRWQKIKDQPLTICDGGHNAQGLQRTFNYIDGISHHQFWLIFGCSDDKDLRDIWPLLKKANHIVFTQAHVPRAMSVEKLATAAAENEIFGEKVENVNQALAQVWQRTDADDLVLVIGSIFMMGEIECI